MKVDMQPITAPVPWWPWPNPAMVCSSISGILTSAWPPAPAAHRYPPDDCRPECRLQRDRVMADHATSSATDRIITVGGHQRREVPLHGPDDTAAAGKQFL